MICVSIQQITLGGQLRIATVLAGVLGPLTSVDYLALFG